jgi:release factor glutamine methyltransferase
VARLRAAGSVFAEEEAQLLLSAARTPAELAEMVEHRAAGVPLEPIVGWAEFCGLRIVVEAGVFVPRLRSSFLVERATALALPHPLVVDLCCGTGAIGVAVAATSGPVDLYAVDIEPAAVRCARRNVEPLGGQVYQGDLFAPLPEELKGRVDLLLANAPYVPTAAIETMPPEARLHEPRIALDGGTDGLDVQRRVATGAATWLAPGGYLLMETSVRQAPACMRMLADAGLRPQLDRSEALDATVVVATPRQVPGPTSNDKRGRLL